MLNLFGSYSPQAGFTGNKQDQLYFDDTPNTPVLPTPEPGSLVLFGLGIGAMALKLRRRAGGSSREHWAWNRATSPFT